MRYPAGQKQSTRARILAAAARTFRRRGFRGAGVDDVMKAAGLTAGGFYAHFASKDALFAEMIQQAFVEPGQKLAKQFEHLEGEELLRAVVERYLSGEHRRNVEEGCPLPPLLPEVARAGKRTRAAFEKALDARLEAFFAKLPARGGLAAREAAIARLATMVGGLALARAVSDERFADEILSACRRHLLGDPGAKRGSAP